MTTRAQPLGAGKCADGAGVQVLEPHNDYPSFRTLMYATSAPSRREATVLGRLPSFLTTRRTRGFVVHVFELVGVLQQAGHRGGSIGAVQSACLCGAVVLALHARRLGCPHTCQLNHACCGRQI